MKVNLLLLFMLLMVFVVMMVSSTSEVLQHAKNVKKRQIYREQVLPHAGGKIPESAFQVDRLALNRLQKEGIAIPDGYILEQRQHQVYQYPQKSNRPVFHVSLTQDRRYTQSEGRYNFKDIPSIETTYLIPQIWMQPVKVSPKVPYKPRLVTKFEIPSSNIKNNRFETPIFRANSNTFGGYPFRHTYVDYNNLWTPFHENYLTTQIFNDFDSFFNSIQRSVRTTEATLKDKRLNQEKLNKNKQL